MCTGDWFMLVFVFPVPLTSDERAFENHSTSKKLKTKKQNKTKQKKHECSSYKLYTFAFMRVTHVGKICIFCKIPVKIPSGIIDLLLHVNILNIFLYNNDLSSMLQFV